MDKSPLVTCPNCSTDMDRLGFEGVYGPAVEIDLCFRCHAMWLDRRESIQLSPRGILDLFKVLHEHEEDARHALGSRIACARCGRRLSLAQDIGKGGRFSYYECPADHGRLTPFSEFLKEKQFVRQLTPAEQSRLEAEVKQVQCSGCGASVDLARGFQCQHCGSPLTVLDADAVEKTLRKLEAADRERTIDDTELAAREHRARALARLEKMRVDRDHMEQPGLTLSFGSPRANTSVDILAQSIGKVFGLF